MSSKRVTIVFGALVIGLFSYIVYSDAVSTWRNLQEQKNKIQQLNTKYQELNQKLDETTETKEQSQEELQRLQKEKDDLEKERQRLEAELQAKIESKRRLAESSNRVINAVMLSQTASASNECGDNDYARYIYSKESGCRLNARSASGCLGLGQACPGTKLLNACPDLNYTCQNAFFTNYAISRYGSWENAYNEWLRKGWW